MLLQVQMVNKFDLSSDPYIKESKLDMKKIGKITRGSSIGVTMVTQGGL